MKCWDIDFDNFAAYPYEENGKYYARMSSGLAQANSSYYDYNIEMLGPFSDMGLGKPAHQNFLSQFIDGMIVQTIDTNQDNVISQSFFIPNVLSLKALHHAVEDQREVIMNSGHPIIFI